MGYLFLIIALLCGATKGFCGKKISGKVNTLKGVFYINTLRMLLCIAIGFFVVAFDNLSGFKIEPYTLLITAVSGLSTALFVVTWIFCVRKGAYVMVDVFLMLGAMVTTALCNMFFGETVTVKHCLGILLLLISSYIMCSYSSNIRGKFTLNSFFILLMCGLFSGMSDFSQKWFVKAVPDGNIAVFNFYTYVFAAVALFIFFVFSNKIEKSENDGKSMKIFLVILVMSACLFANSYFKTIAAIYLDSAILYPLSSGMSIVLSALMAAVFFCEKITKKCVLGIALTFCAIIVMNL